ncbi:hypothetical protein GUJ93_ZPchr0001g31586 [Zizania palustris]|uniref:Box C/D snoRNA protein 1 n=1 Tax=Zizania palustris TaxID=103762 RepID=A0A8J5SEJ1_ZIZPA|nr:hypothetical protein GUJ93_ZPchr0001g31586 [Zizania palustris]
MEEEQEQGGEPQPAPNPTPGIGGSSSKGTPCEECGERPWKYRCPGCSRLTCSLPCVQSHKRRTACTGKRPRADPVPLSQFDDNHLLSDYNFLEETNQVIESAHRLIGGPASRYLSPLSSQGMARREKNRSWHNYRKDCIYWTLEWKFNSRDVPLTDHNIDEHTSLLSLLEKQLTPGPWKDQLIAYRNADLRDLKLFIQKSAKESISQYCQLSIEEPLGPQLMGISIVDSTDSPDLEGTKFHEEEIEEGELAPQTQVIDLNDCGTSHATYLASVKDTDSTIYTSGSSKAKNCMKVYPLDIEEIGDVGSLNSGRQNIGLMKDAASHPGNLVPVKGVTVSKTDSNTDSLEPSSVSILASDDFSGSQETGYAYSDLFGDMDADPFFNFDLDMIDEDGSVGVTSPFELWDDLEEGEIPSASLF